MKRVSLKVIARELGVSVATVSLVLNGKNENGRVSKEVSQKILNKAKELDYTPNSLAKGLKLGRSKTLGLIVADISNVFFGTLAFYIQEYAEERGYTVIIVNTNEQEKKMSKMIKLLKSRQVDGFIITPTENSQKLIEELVAEKTPLVLVDRCFPSIKANSVLINNYEISFQATRQLILQGCKNIALLTYKQDHYHINERKRGFIEALQQESIFNPNNVKEVRYEYLKSDIEKSIKEIINQSVDGIFFATNTISILGLKCILKNNNDSLQTIKYMCFDESDAFYLLPYTIPFVKQPIEEMAQHAIQILIDEIEEKNYEPEVCYLNAELVLK